MSGIGIEVRVGGDAARKVAQLLDKIEDKATFFAAASEIMLDQTQARFRDQRDPEGNPWEPLAARTVEKRGGRATPILEMTGVLRGTLHAAPEADRAVVRTMGLPYAAIHQNGGEAGDDNMVEIPARPYLGFGDEDERELLELAERMLLP